MPIILPGPTNPTQNNQKFFASFLQKRSARFPFPDFFSFSPPTPHGLCAVMISNAPFMPSDPSERFAMIFRALQRS
ncbi:hypothetical protein, partial [Acidiphilium rubrum]|uniref:hypothetical protein n=1 Tax=Acidiphilium rubrum TaxID=526 RepID=UPI001C376F07